MAASLRRRGGLIKPVGVTWRGEGASVGGPRKRGAPASARSTRSVDAICTRRRTVTTHKATATKRRTRARARSVRAANDAATSSATATYRARRDLPPHGGTGIDGAAAAKVQSEAGLDAVVARPGRVELAVGAPRERRDDADGEGDDKRDQDGGDDAEVVSLWQRRDDAAAMRKCAARRRGLSDSHTRCEAM